MKPAVVLDTNDIKKILAEKFGVPEENIVKSQYTYTVITAETEPVEPTEE